MATIPSSSSKLYDLLYGRFIKPYSTIIMIIFLLIIFAIIARYGYVKYYKSKSEKVRVQDSPITIYYFYADWCPHCTKTKKDWTSFESKFDGKKMNGYVVSCKRVDCSNKEKPDPLQTKYNVFGYPTVLAIKYNGSVEEEIKYESKITTDNLESFLNSITNE